MSPDNFLLIDSRPSATERSNFTGKYNKSVVGMIVKSAKKHGVDPYTAVAMSLQESKLGRDTPAEPLHGWGASGKTWPDVPVTTEMFPKYNTNSQIIKRLMKEDRESGYYDTGRRKAIGHLLDENHGFLAKRKEAYKKASLEHLPNNIDKEVKYIKDKFDYAHNVFKDGLDEELMIQTYNGVGWLPDRQFYGAEKRLHGKRDRPYGKRIIELRESAIKKNPEIRKMVDGDDGYQDYQP